MGKGKEKRMREYICDLCLRKIEPADIRMSFDVEVDGKKKDHVDMHSRCYYYFMAKAREDLKENERL